MKAFSRTTCSAPSSVESSSSEPPGPRIFALRHGDLGLLFLHCYQLLARTLPSAECSFPQYLGFRSRLRPPTHEDFPRPITYRAMRSGIGPIECEGFYRG